MPNQQQQQHGHVQLQLRSASSDRNIDRLLTGYQECLQAALFSHTTYVRLIRAMMHSPTALKSAGRPGTKSENPGGPVA